MSAARSGPSAPSAASHSLSPAPERLRLRNSCHACASSKLKCSQEKPTCSRCAKRHLPCEYVAAKPAGRKPSRRESITSQGRGDHPPGTTADANNDVQPRRRANWFAPPPSNPSTHPLHSPRIIRQSPLTSMLASSNVIQDLFGPMDEIPSSASAASQVELSDYFSIPVSFGAEMGDMDFLGAGNTFSTGVDSSINGSEGLFDAFPVFDDAVPGLFNVSVPSPTPKTFTLASLGATQNSQDFRATESPHSCLVRALRSMEQISSVSSLEEAYTIPTIRAIFAKNKAAIEAVSTILKCPCSQDGYLFAVISLTLFMVLDWYTAVARQTPNLQDLEEPDPRPSSASKHALPNPTIVGNYCLEGADSARMVGQLVLSELHLVRRLVEQLSSKLKEQAAKRAGGSGTETPESLNSENEMAQPLSAAMYDQLGVGLAQRLRALSLETIDRLRKL